MPSTPTLSAMASEAERETKMRKHVYAGLVARGKMRQAEADYKIVLMEKIHGTLVNLQEYLAKRKETLDDLSGGTPSNEADADRDGAAQ